MRLGFQRRIFATFRDILAAAALALLVPVQVEAQEGGRGFDPREIYQLPMFCKYTQIYRKHVPGGNNPAEIERWTALMGDTFRHMHHYCWALQTSNRAAFESTTREEKIRWLTDSIGDLDYVIQRAPLDFPMLPDVLSKKGDVLIRLDRAGEGMLEFQRAIKVKPEYWQAYAAMSDFYKETGQIAKAREWLEKGLSAAPNAKALKERSAQLDSASGKRKNDPQRPMER
jgi:tetratricopeptide (TPR) repeat protein